MTEMNFHNHKGSTIGNQGVFVGAVGDVSGKAFVGGSKWYYYW